MKSDFIGIKSENGIYASLIMAEIIIQSNWGRHPISKHQFKAPKEDGSIGSKYSNNLALLQPCSGQKVKVNTYGGIEYVAFKDWKTFATGYSDHLTFSGKYDDILKESNLLNQINLFSLTKEPTGAYNSSIIKTITICSEVFNVRKG